MLHQFHKDFAKYLHRFNDIIKYVTTLFILMPFCYEILVVIITMITI